MRGKEKAKDKASKRWKEVRDRAGQGHGTGQKEKDLWFRSDFTRFARSTVMVVLCNKIHIVCSILIIPPCQVAATKKSDFKKHKVLEGVTERQEKTGERKDGHFTKKQRQENPLKDSLVKFFLFFFFSRSHHIRQRKDLMSFPPGNSESSAVPSGRTMSSYDTSRAPFAHSANSSIQLLKC